MSRSHFVRPPTGKRWSLLLLATLLLALVPASTIHAATAALSISITDTRSTAESGDLLTYTLRIRNSGSVALSNVRVRVTLPTTVTFAGASDSPTNLGGGRYEWQIASVAATSTFFRYISVQVNGPLAPGTVITSSAAVDQIGDVTPNTASDSTTVEAPSVSLSPASLSFAPQVVNTTSAAQPVTLTNSGTAPLTLSSIGVSGDFAQTNDCPTTLPADASCTINVTFAPTAVGARSGTLTVISNAVSSPHTVSLGGTSIGPSTSYDRALLDFGTQRVGTTSTPLTTTLTNSGTAPLTIVSITVNGDYSIDTTTCPVGTPLAVAASCTISITFQPSTTGMRNGTLTISSDSPSSPDLIALTGVGAQASVSLDKTVLSFGNQRVDTTSATQPVTLTNSGQVPVALSSVGVSGDFAQINDCPATLPAGASCTINVTFTPTAVGARSGTLTIADDAPGSPRTINLSGSGIQPAIDRDRTSIDFDDQRVGTTSAAQTVTLTNSGSGPLTIASLTPSGDFAVSSTTCPLSPATLAAGTSCTVSLTFTPTTTGARSGALTISDDAPGSPHTVDLTGTGVQPGVTLDPSPTLDFGNQRVSVTSATRTVTITNSGTSALRINFLSISPGGEFSFSGTTCPISSSTLAAGASCTISVTFRPSTTGMRSATLSVNSNAPGTPHQITVTGIGALPGVTLDPATTLDFGEQRVAVASAARTVTITNSGGVDLTINTLSLAPDGEFEFSNTTCPLSPARLAAGASCTISVTFRPSTTGMRSATLAISNDAQGSPHSVTMTGVGVQPAVTLDRSSLEFGDQTVSTTSAAQTVTLTNSGTGPLTISDISTSGDFTQTNTCPATLAAAASCTVSVAFRPTATGARTGILTMSNDAGGSPRTVSLSGIGVQSTVELSPTSLDFGGLRVNTTSAAQTVTLTNSGTGPLTISGIGVSGDFAQTNTCPATLPASISCTIDVTFTPAAIGARSGTLTITNNAPGSPHTLGLTGTGLDPAIGLDQTSLSFGTQRVNVTSAAQTITLTNSGTAPLTIASVTASGDFAIDGTTCPLGPMTLAASASCTINVTFTPTVTSARTGALTITNNASGSPHTVDLTGTGVQPGVYLSASNLAFGAQRLSLPSQPRAVTLSNNGTSDLRIESIQATGDFTQSSDCPSVLAADASCTIEMVFTPTVAGPRTGAVTITDDAGGSPRTVSLSGSGVIMFSPPSEFRLYLPFMSQ